MAATGRQITYVGADGIETIELVEAQIFGFGDESSRPASGDVVGDMYIVLDTTLDQYRLDVWDGAAWNTISDRKANTTAITDPTVTDDITAGYEIGSIWVNTVSDTVFIATDVTATAAVWSQVGSGDVSGPGVTVQEQEIVRFSSITGTSIEGSGVRMYDSAATDPSIPTPDAGDLYYNTAQEMWMFYDGTRSKWLSVEPAVFTVGKRNNLPGGAYLRGMDRKTFTSTNGYRARYNGTVVSITYTRDDIDPVTFEVVANGVAITNASIISTALGGQDNTLNGDFSQGDVLAVRNQAGGNNANDVQVWVTLRWRTT